MAGREIRRGRILANLIVRRPEPSTADVTIETTMLYKLPLIFDPQPEGGFTVTSPVLPELLTEGDTFDEAMENVRDALEAVIEIYRDGGRTLPPEVLISNPAGEVRADMVIGLP